MTYESAGVTIVPTPSLHLTQAYYPSLGMSYDRVLL